MHYCNIAVRDKELCAGDEMGRDALDLNNNAAYIANKKTNRR